MIGKKINQLATELAPVSTDLTIIGDPDSGVSKKITLAQLGAIFSGAVSFYTNLAGFPVVGDINVIYCAKDTQKLYLWSGSAYVEVFPSQALLDTYQLRSEKGVSNGYASLDVNGKVPISQLPSSLMEYLGTWNAATNTPTLANGTGDNGDVYLCNAAGTVNFGAGPITFAVGDWVIYNGTIWERSSGAVGTVTSVAATITGDAIGITGSPVTTSGTLAFAFGGNSTQYINGAGNLITFPSIISQAANLVTEVYNKTGATLTKGTIVYINGGQGNLPTVTKAIATGDSTSAQTFGIVQADITNNNNGYVVIAGRLSDIDTQAYTEGTQLYLSSTTAGTWTSTKQYAPAHLVYVGIVVRAHPTQGIIEVKIQNGYELDELHDVAAQTPTNNDGLFWESSTSLWKNKSIATILGYTPQAQLNGTGFVKASGTTISYDNSTYVTTDTFQTISASKTFSVGFSIASAGGTNQISVFQNTNSLFSGSGGSNIFGFNSANNIYFGKGLDNGGVLQWNNSAVRYYTLPDATGTIALVGGSGVGTVTSVGLSAPTGFSVSGSPVTSSGTLALSFASGYSLPTDTKQSNWDTAYNSRIVSVVAPLTFSLNTLGITQATGSSNGYLSSADWTTFNNKQSALTNPVTGTGTTNYLPKFTGTSTIGNSSITDDGSTVSVGNTLKLSGNSNSFQVASIFRNANRVFFGGDTGGYYFQNSGNTATILNLNDSGNLGLGVTPSAWNSDYVALQFGAKGLLYGRSGGEVAFGTNWYRSSGGSFLYATNGFASYQAQADGVHYWFQAPSGTAGNAISFTQAMTLDASGRLGIGTTSPTEVLHLNKSSGTGTFIRFQDTGGDGVYIGSRSNRMELYAGGSERLRITSDGLVGIGTTSPSYRLVVNSGIDGISAGISGSTYGIRFDNGGTFSSGMSTIHGVDATLTGSYQPIMINGSDVRFGTSANERMRITSGGDVYIGNSTISTSSTAIFLQKSGLITNVYAYSSGTINLIEFYRQTTGAIIGTISYNGTLTSYNVTSDYRLKQDYKDYSGLDLVNKIKTYDYEWKADKTRGYGVIAHELQSVINYAVTGVKDGKEMQGVDYSKIVPVLIKAIQELNDKIK